MRFFRSAPETPATHTGRGRQVEFANRQNALGVRLRFGPPQQHLLIAGALALFHHTPPHPPHQRMEPERGLHNGVQCGGKVIAPLHMAKLMGDHRAELRRIQPFQNSVGQQQHRPENAEHARLYHRL